jgi:hypothetical protein
MPQAAPVLATEAAVATTMTAAEIAAAQAAAAHAAQVAAAQTLAAEQAAALAAQQATAATATNVATSGIQTLAKEVSGNIVAGMDANQIASINTPVHLGYADKGNLLEVGNAVSTPVGASSATPSAIPPVPNIPPVTSQLPPIDTAKFGTEYLYSTMPGSVPPTLPASPAAPLYSFGSPSLPGKGTNFLPDIVPQAPAPAPVVETPSLGGAGTGYRGQAVQIGSGGDATPYTAAELQAMQGQSPSGIESLFNQGLDFAKKNPLSVATGANALAMYLNKPEPYEKEKYKSTFKPGLYTGYTPVQPTPYQPQYAGGGLADLGGYSDGGRMLKGPGDGMSDDIPATIANKQPARLANEEFVIPADVVSHLGNGSSEAGAKQLYKMMERVRKARTGNKKQGKQINPEKYLA